MIKFLSQNDAKLIFNYLQNDELAFFSAVTEFYSESVIPDGTLAAQYSECKIVSFALAGESFSCLFSVDEGDLDEVKFAVGGVVHSCNFLPFEKTGEYYLLRCENSGKSLVNKGNSSDFEYVLKINGATETENLRRLFITGNLQPFVIPERGGGFIINSQNYSVISHVFVNAGERNCGVGTEIVKNLLKLSCNKNIYLLSEEKNLGFYKNAGFEKVLTIHKYNVK